ncbi:MAG: cupin domain-containing protein [Candidatus Omnitrophica bacterium]|nr:cupin domain-containing protein [Candidatus Omnitrophota bacterium]MBU4149067.1 cupin domain-containing protein [Candidatus Omnitrophota bacterium]
MDNKARVLKLEYNDKYQRLISKESGSHGLKMGHVVLKPGESVGSHTTAEREEAIVVLKGDGEAQVGNDSAVKIRKNSVLYIPPWTDHDIKNTGTDILEYIFITSLAQDL